MPDPTDEVLLPVPDAPQQEAPVTEDGALRGGRCADCGASSFPQAFICPRCNATDISAAELPGSGELYSYTTVHVSSSFPTPYTVGYVDLPGDLRVLAQVRIPEARLRCDLPVHVRIDAESPTGWAFHETEGAGR